MSADEPSRMNLREYVTTETSAFVDRLTAAAEAAARHAASELRGSADAEIGTLRAQLEAETARAGVLDGLLRDAEETLAVARTQTDEAIAIADGLQAGMRTVRAQQQEAAALLTESIDTFDALATASTVADLFRTLVEQLSLRFPRVVLFRRRAQRFEGEVAAGLDPLDVTTLSIAMGTPSMITRTATQGIFEYATTEQIGDSSPLPGGAPAFAVAAPLVFQGETLAVVYAESDEDKGEAPAAFAGVLAAHTSVLLSRLKQELKVAQELREYAQMLLHEAEEMFVADTKEGRTTADRLRRLRETIDFGRQLYTQRAALEGAAAAGLLEEEITTLVDAEPVTPFGSALCAALAEIAAHDVALR